MLHPSDEFRLGFDVRLVGGNAADGYSWQEVAWSESDSDYIAPPSARAGSNSLFERNGQTVTLYRVVLARFRATVSGTPTYEFSA